jgi:hypothetical protein
VARDSLGFRLVLGGALDFHVRRVANDNVKGLRLEEVVNMPDVAMDDLYAAFQAVLRDAFFCKADGGHLDFKPCKTTRAGGVA